MIVISPKSLLKQVLKCFTDWKIYTGWSEKKGFMARSSDSLPEVLAVVLLRPAAADVESRCGACNVSCHRENPYGKS